MGWMRRVLVILALALGALAPASAQQSAQRYALVIGNAAYRTPGWELVNPVNDATLIAARLRGLGFQVTPLNNATKAQMEAAMNAFTARVSAAGPEAVGVFYYAGHGVEHDGANLLVPVDVTARSMDELRYQAPPMQFLLRDMARAGNKVNVIILDACRNLPLPAGSRAGPAGGLADLADVPDNVLIAYATRPGLTAPDNPGDTNSVFTRTLSEALASNPSDTAVNLFSQVQARVFSATGRAQRPEFRSGLLRAPDWRFAALTTPPASTPAAPPPAMDAATVEALTWQGALAANSVAAFEDYLRQFPQGRFRIQAQQNIARLRTPVSAPAVAVPPPVATRPNTAATAGQTIRDCAECPEMVVIPAGTFVMGSPASEAGRASNEGPQRTVRIGSIAVSRFEITFAQWDACVAVGGCGGYRPVDQGWGRGNQPVINVSWNDVQSYVTWINAPSRGNGRYRLLTEAEWEYAARAGTTGAYWFGAEANPSNAKYSVNGNNRDSSTVRVGSYAANGFGLFDTAGNVQEWVEDCYATSYSGAPADGSAFVNQSCHYRVLRGGTWGNSPFFVRSANRIAGTPTDRDNGTGFRLARTL